MTHRTHVKKKPAKKKPQSSPPKTKEYRILVREHSMLDQKTWRTANQARKAKMDSLVKQNPREALNTARAALDYAGELLLKVIASQRLLHKIERTDGSEYDRTDDAVACLGSRISWLTKDLVKLARNGYGTAIIYTWCGASRFARCVTFVPR